MTETPLPSAALRVGEGRAAAAAALRHRIIPGDIRQAIAQAAQRTSVDFDFLVAQAEVESAMDPRAKAAGSSATGLYQFIESTWLGTLKRHGPRFGLGGLADQISLSRAGTAQVRDPATRTAILQLREDPQIAALMAAALAEDNRAELMPVLGRQPDHGELYLAHFLGAGSAARFLAQLQADPDQSAAALFRRSAGANRAIFYEPGGAPRSLAGVMEHLGAKMNRALGLSQARAMPPENIAAAIAPPGAASPGSPQQTRLTMTPAPPLPPAGALPRTSGGRAMSSLLADSLAATGAPGSISPPGAAQVKRAYAQLRALGL